MSSTSSPRKTLFLVGPGLIGSSLLVKLLSTRKDLDLYALTRRTDQASQLKSLGINPIQGSLSDHDLIAEWSRKADIIIHSASADDDAGAFAIVDGIQSRDKNAGKVIYIQTSGNDELVRSRLDLKESGTISDTWTDEQIDARIQSDAYHRHVDGPLRQRLFNQESERKYNAVTAIMMPPLIYGIGSEPFNRISIQTPMLTQYMMQNGAFTLPASHEAGWNAVWVHDLVDAYVLLLSDLEKATPGQRTSHYVFPAEAEPFKWKEHFDAVVSQLKEAGHPSAKSVRELKGPEEFEELIGGKENPYGPCFRQLVYGQHNSYTRPEYLQSFGFTHKAKGVIDSIVNGKELAGVIAGKK